MINRRKKVYKKQEIASHEETEESSLRPHHTEAEVSKKELELLTRHLQSIHSSCGHCSKQTFVRALRRKKTKPLILRLPRDFVCPSCQEINNQRLHPVASLEAILSKWRSIQIDQAEWIHTSDNLKHKFSVIIDEGLSFEGCQDAYPMRDADLHRNPIRTELRDFYLEQWVCYFGKP